MCDQKNKWKILITGPEICDEAKKILYGNSEVIYTPKYISSNNLKKLIKKQQTEVLIVRRGNITREVIASSSALKAIIKHGTGFDNIDIVSATEYKIPVLITSKANLQSVAEHTVALIYALAKKLLLNNNEIKINHVWDSNRHQSEELFQKCIGIVGVGRVGLKVIELISPLKMKVFAYDPFVSEKDLPQGVIRVKSLKDLLQQADIVSIHCTLNKDTYHLFGIEEFNIMKTTSYLINTSRGKIIDETALVNALKKGLISGGGIDVFEEEPPSFMNPIFKLNNIITTPHTAGPTKEALNRMGITAARMALMLLEGREKEIEKDAFVNPKVLNYKNEDIF